MVFSRQEYWSELPFPSPEIFLTQGLNMGLLNCRQVLYHMSHQESPPNSKSYHYYQYHKSHYLPISEHLLFAWQRIAKGFFFKTSSFFIFYRGSVCEQCCGSLRWTVERLSHTETCIHFPPKPAPNQADTWPWAEFHVLYGGSLLVICFKYSLAISSFPRLCPLATIRSFSKSVSVFLFCSVQFSRSVTFNSLWPHGRQHARLPCPSPFPGACSNSCLSSWWWYPSLLFCR